MKIYEKPLAKIEKILVEDVITTSVDPIIPQSDKIHDISSNSSLTGVVGGDTEAVIVFEW